MPFERIARGAVLCVAIGLFAAGCSVALSFDGLAGGTVSPAGEQGGRADGGLGPDISTKDDGGRGRADADDAGKLPVQDASPGPDGSLAPPADAATDARVEAGPVGGYCNGLSPRPAFCDDFDVADLVTMWDQVFKTGGRPERVTTVSRSAPSSLRIQIDALAQGAPIAAFVLKSLPALTNKPVSGAYAFALRADTLDPTQIAVLASLRYFSGGADYWELQIVGRASGNGIALRIAEVGSFNGGSFYQERSIAPVLPLGEWHRVRVEMKLANINVTPSANTARVLIDDVERVPTFALSGGISATPPALGLGSGYVSGATTPWTFYFDDAVLDLKSP